MLVFQLDDLGYLVGQCEADESPRQPGFFLIPGGCVSDPPPAIGEGQRARHVGGQWTVEVIQADPEPEPVIADISDRQFAQGLAELGLISEADAEEWVAAGTLPPALMALVDQLPAEERFPARMLLRGATRLEFNHPLAKASAQLAVPPWTTEARAAFWRHCATL